MVINNWYGAGTGPIWLDDVDCGGSETFIGDCYHRRWGSHDCRHHEDVSIACTDVTITTTTERPPSPHLGTTEHVQSYRRLVVYHIKFVYKRADWPLTLSHITVPLQYHICRPIYTMDTERTVIIALYKMGQIYSVK